jgi:signal peptidase I
MSSRRLAVVIAACILLGSAVVVAVAVQVLFDAYRIPSQAMAPTLTPGDRVLVRSIGGSDAHRGDIVIFHPPAPAAVGSQASTRISRVVAVAGDRVEAKGGRLMLNGRVAEEPYLPRSAQTSSFSPTVVPRNSVYVIGDNRTNSQDSRFYGPVGDRDVVARVSLQNLPLDWITLAAVLVLGAVLVLVLVVPAIARWSARA